MFQLNIFRLTQVICRATARNASSETVTTVPSPRYAQMKAKQAAMCVDDGIPVHLKSGFADRLLFRATWCLVLAGTFGGLHTCYTLIVKK